jgi:hypothetical protein
VRFPDPALAKPLVRRQQHDHFLHGGETDSAVGPICIAHAAGEAQIHAGCTRKLASTKKMPPLERSAGGFPVASETIVNPESGT